MKRWFLLVGAALAGLGTGVVVWWRRRRSGERGNRVADAMTANPQAVGRETTVAEAARLMRVEDVGSLPVVEDGRLVGILTDRDIVVRVVADERDPQTTTVQQVASEALVTVAPEQDLDEALQLMARHQVRRLPVVEEGRRLVGIVAQADVAREDETKAGELVEDVSRPTEEARG